MSEIDIEAVRRVADEFILSLGHNDPAKLIIIRMETALDQLAKENERLTKERDEFLRDATTCGQAAMRHKDERDQAQAYNAQQDLVIDTLRTKLAAMQEAIVEAVRREEERRAQWPGPSQPYITEPLRPHLPTPEPEPVDPLVEVLEEFFDGSIPALDQEAERLRAALSARGLEVRKIGEGE